MYVFLVAQHVSTVIPPYSAVKRQKRLDPSNKTECNSTAATHRRHICTSAHLPHTGWPRRGGGGVRSDAEAVMQSQPFIGIS